MNIDPTTPNKRRALRILGILKQMADEKTQILDHIEKGGKFSDLKINKDRRVKVI